MSLLRRLLTVLVAVLLIAVPASLAQGAPGGGGPPDGKGGGPPADAPRPDVGGGKPDGAGTKKGDIYADLWVIARAMNGTPLTVPFVVEGEEGLETHVCVQPITTTDTGYSVPAGAYPTFGEGEDMYFVPLVGLSDPEAEPCDLDPAYADLAQETELGRLNLGRSPERVVDKQLADVIATLTADGATVGLDPSGRLQALATIDSPLQNMAAFQAILERGRIELLDKDDNVISWVDTSGLDLVEFQQAATALAAATPKEEEFHVYVDTVQYLSRILNIPDDTEWTTVSTPLLTDARGEQFLNFAQFPQYTRQNVFKGCVVFKDEYQPAWPEAAWLEDLVTFSTAASGTFSGLEAFTQLTADSRAVLVWLHDMDLVVESASSVGSDQVLVDGELTSCTAVVPPPQSE